MNAASLEPELLWRMYREMRRIRLVDDRLTALQRQGRVGYWSSCRGQEAVPVATALTLREEDWIFPALRESGALLVRGFPLSRYLAQCFGTRQDVLKGRQMPGHASAKAVRHVNGSSVVGTQLSHCVGAALAARRSGSSAVMVGFLGDGAVSAPDFHASLNFAAVLGAPCVLICQNNHYALSTRVERQTAVPELARKAAAYAVPAQRVDGNDVVAVYQAVAQAVETARTKPLPVFIEALTYRVGPHSTSDDPSRYRSGAELAEWERLDPISRHARYLTDRSLLDAGREQELTAELEGELAGVLREAEGQPPPPPASLFDDVYADRPWHLEEQCAELLRLPPRDPPGSPLATAEDPDRAGRL